MSTSSRRLLQLLSIAALVAGAGCGPFGYLKKVAKDASKAVADAKAAEAELYAPYEYWGAVSYLEQAKVLMAYSEYERSFDYGVRAKQLAEEAKTKAEKRESGAIKEAVSLPGSEDAGGGGGQADGAASGQAEGGASKSKGGAKAKGKVEVGGSVGGGK
ncbi:DUF4398 domain-containing protein [Paraliomyxa miuraensis]|uniref:DUF4398 domain-containing protein n=1 Tax=Paraliomyxa miuraensis TaxID=376150 RepID=UPI0022575600|nr:DUF4398 domain-containing protein [Paraliomyxa miuraensis]MCX4245395.1 DUF4398 domain-containing protein [Paraliomyxa miuraensis]